RVSQRPRMFSPLRSVATSRAGPSCMKLRLDIKSPCDERQRAAAEGPRGNMPLSPTTLGGRRIVAESRPIAASRAAAAVPACLLAWLLPGAGHLYLRRTAKGFVFLGALGALFLLGVLMDARLQLYVGLDDPLAFLRSLAQMALGL